MAIKLQDWRKNEPSLKEIIKRYPDVSPFVIFKTDVLRRGIKLSVEAQKYVNPSIHQIEMVEIEGKPGST